MEKRCCSTTSQWYDERQTTLSLSRHRKDTAKPMANSMKALVKRSREPGLWLEDVPVPEFGINDVLIKIRQDGHLRHRRAHLELGRLGAEDHPRADGHRPRVRRHDRRGRQQRARPGHRRHRHRRGARRLRTLPQLPGRPPPSVQGHQGRRRQPARRVRRISVHPGDQRLARRSAHSAGPAEHLRSVRQRHAHRACLRGAGRGRADHRRRPDRHHGDRDRPARRAHATS